MTAIETLAHQPLGQARNCAAFLAVTSIGSDYERHRVLTAVVARSPDAASRPRLARLCPGRRPKPGLRPSQT